MKTLVTGGAGFIGSNLSNALACDGHDVVVLDNLVTGKRSNFLPYPNIRFIEGDVRDERIVNQVMERVEVVFHLAASVGNKRSIDNPILDAEVNVLGTIKVLDAARREGVRKVVAASSAGIFGELRTLPIKEDHPLEPDSPYGCTKLCEEKQCLAFGRMYGFEVVCLRYFNVYGVGSQYDAYGNVIPIFATRMFEGKPLTVYGDGEQTRDFVNVADVVQANIKAAEASGVSGAFCIGSGRSVSINHLIDLMSEASGLSPAIECAPPRLGDVRDSLADITAARELLGYEPCVELRDGIREYMGWAKITATSRKYADV